MKSDEVNPMVELERLFNERRRVINFKDNLETEIKTLKTRLSVQEDSLVNTNANIANLETAIRDLSKKL